MGITIDFKTLTAIRIVYRLIAEGSISTLLADPGFLDLEDFVYVNYSRGP